MEKPSLQDTIEDGVRYVRANLEDGCHCPVCSQHAKLYHRKITSSMAAGLIVLYEATGGEPGRAIHIESHLSEMGYPTSLRGDFAKLRFWELATPHREKPGYYSITSKGRYFVEGRVQVPRTCKIYNNECHGFGAQMTDIRRALGDKFDYQELMGRPYEPTYQNDNLQTNMF